MKIRRTANAGVLIDIDGITILLDGVCEATEYYLGTPDEIRTELCERVPDIVGFTHKHRDHYDEDYAMFYHQSTLRPILGSECSALKVGNVRVRAVPTRHIGKNDTLHSSFIIEGSRCIFFMGDASPLEWKRMKDVPEPDVLIVPFAYANTSSAWEITKGFNAKNILLVHMPDIENDPYGIWKSVEMTVKNEKILYFTKIGDTITLQ